MTSGSRAARQCQSGESPCVPDVIFLGMVVNEVFFFGIHFSVPSMFPKETASVTQVSATNVI